MREDVYDLKPVRTMHAVDAEVWLGKPGCAYWCEWDHYGETPRSFTSIVTSLEQSNWPKFIRPGSVCIDIGGHSGDTAIPMGLFCYDKVAGARGHVIVVEPNPEVLKVMKLNLAMNAHIANFSAVPCAITSSDVAEIELSDHGNAHCNGGITASETYSSELQGKIEAASVNRYKARGVTLPTLLAEAGIADLNTVSFIKLDCEGYDKEILRGSCDFIHMYKPTLFVEWFAWFSPEDDADFFKAIDEIGYVAFHPTTLEKAIVTERLSDVVCLHRTKLSANGAFE